MPSVFKFRGAHASALRIFAGHSRTQVADQLGVSRETVRLIETCGQQPSPGLALAYAALLAVDLDDLYEPVPS